MKKERENSKKKTKSSFDFMERENVRDSRWEIVM